MWRLCEIGGAGDVIVKFLACNIILVVRKNPASESACLIYMPMLPTIRILMSESEFLLLTAEPCTQRQ